MITAFLALELPDQARFDLGLIQPRLPLPDPVDPEDFHLTLAYLGPQADPLLEDLHFALESLHARPFALTLQGSGVFGADKPRAVWAGVAPQPALEALAAKLANAARRVGMRLEARRFSPHVTLARARAMLGPDEAARLAAGLTATAGFRSGPFLVSEFCLMQSHPGRQAPRYEVLMRYPLIG